jgi:signal peptidase
LRVGVVDGRIEPKYQLLTVTSGSMVPTMEIDSLSILKHVEISEIKVNDIITFINPSGYVITHRVIRDEPGEGGRLLTTKGDANPIEDPYQVREDMILGRIEYTFNWAVPVVSILNRHQGSSLIATAEVLVIAVLIYVLVSIIAYTLGYIIKAVKYGIGLDKLISELERDREKNSILISELVSIKSKIAVYKGRRIRVILVVITGIPIFMKAYYKINQAKDESEE